MSVFSGIVLSLVLFGAALRFEFQSYDDHHFVRDNPHLSGGFTWESVQWALTANLFGVDRNAEYWMPFTMASRLLDAHFFGADGGWHHLQNLILHGWNAALLFLLLHEATGRMARSLLVAGLFLVHPLMMEVVGWVALRKDVLTSTFCLLALWGHVRFGRTGSRPSYLFSLAAFAAALASKPSSMSFPLALLLFDLWPLQRCGQPWEWRRVATCCLEKVPFGLLAIASAGLTYVGQSDAGTAHAEQSYAFSDRVLSTLIGFGEYLQRALLPDLLCVLYPLPKAESLSVGQGVWMGAGLLLLTLLWLALALRGRWAGLVGWIWFIGLTLPVTGLVQFGRQATADRYMYLPLIGLLFALVWTLADAWRALAERDHGSDQRTAWVPAGVATVLLVVFALQARQQLGFWQNGVALWERAMKVVPDHVYAIRMVGRELTTQGQVKPGEAYLLAAVKMAPDRVDVQATYGIGLARHGRYAEALPYLERALKLAPLQLPIHRTLVSTLQALGREEEARRAWVRLHLVRLDAFVRKALEFIDQGEAALARGQFELAWSAASEAREEARGARLFRPGTKFWAEIERGIQSFPRRAAGESDVPYVQLCVRYLQGGAAEALSALPDLLRQFPREEDLWWRLAICRLELGQTAEANAAAEQARRIARGPTEAAAEWERVRGVAARKPAESR